MKLYLFNTVKIPSSLTVDPINRQGFMGKVIKFDLENEVVSVKFDDGAIGFYKEDIFSEEDVFDEKWIVSAYTTLSMKDVPMVGKYLTMGKAINVAEEVFSKSRIKKVFVTYYNKGVKIKTIRHFE